MASTAQISAKEYIDYTKLGDYAVSSDGSYLACVASIAGANELWLLDTGLKNAPPRRLTTRNESIVDVSTSPDDKMIYFCSDTEGNELYSIHAVSRDGQKAQRLFSDMRWSYFAPQHLPGDVFMYSSDKIRQSTIASYIRYGLSGAEREIHIDGYNTFISDISSDHNRLILYCLEDNTSQKIYHFDIRSGKAILVSGSSRQAYCCLGGSFIGNEQTILFAATLESDRFQFYQYDLHSNETQPCLNFLDDIFSYEVSPGRRFLALIIEEGLQDRLEFIDMLSGQRVPHSARGSCFSTLKFAADGQTLFYKASEGNRPENVCRWDMTLGRRQIITKHIVNRLPEEATAIPKEIYYRSFDGRRIPSLLYLTSEKSNRESGAVIVWIHGGPHLVEKKHYNPMFQFLLSRGFSVFCPNFRGSAGFGVEFLKLAQKDWGGGPRRDILAGIDWLVHQGHAQKTRIVIGGSSYGGYLALLMAGMHPDYSAATIDFFGPSNLISFINAAPEHLKCSYFETIGHPSKDKQHLEAISPITYASNITKPVMVVQGANDARVVRAESDRMVAHLRQRNVRVEYLVFKDEGHEFTRLSNKLIILEKMATFIDSVLA